MEFHSHNYMQLNGSFPLVAPHPHNAIRPSSIALAPSISSFWNPEKTLVHGPAYSPSVSTYKRHHTRNHVNIPESHLIPPPTYSQKGMIL